MKAGELITQLRRYRGLTKQALAEKMQLSKQRIGQIEASDDVYFSTMQLACKVLDFEIVAIPKEQATKEPIGLITDEPK